MNVRRKEKARIHPTAFDVIVVAVVPALIIGMICCLLFFLVLAFYQGDYDIRLMYLLGLFSMGTVLIARIAADNGRAYANAFSFPLAIAAGLAMFQFVRITGPLGPASGFINIGLLALAWFLADRITFDCTVIDEREKSQQQGLLQSLGMLKRDTVLVSAPTITSSKKTKQKSHNPGVWVLYFALLALPLFGLGQLSLPATQSTTAAFAFLVGYLGCSLCLLVATSFLSVRRYVRQKGVQMPPDMSRSWLGGAFLAVIALLAVCCILPLPGRNLGLISLPISFESPDDLKTSRHGWGNEGKKDDDNPESAKASDDEGPQTGGPNENAQGNPQASKSGESEQSGEQGDSGPKSNDSSKNSNSESSQSQPQDQNSAKSRASEGQPESDNSEGQNSEAPDVSDQPADPSNADPQVEQEGPDAAKDDSQPAEGNAQGQPEDSSSSSAGSRGASLFANLSADIPALVKWLTIAILAAIVVIYIILNPGEIARLLRSISEFLAQLLGGRKHTAAEPPQAKSVKLSPTPPSRPFREFANPFAEKLRGWTPEQVVSHTFLALQAWSAEHGANRGEDITAAEFARQLEHQQPVIGKHGQTAASMVDRLLFANWRPSAEEITQLEPLWRVMQTH